MAVTTAIVDSRPKVRAGDPLAVSMVSTRNRGNASGAKATRSIDAGSVTKKRRDYVGKTPAKAAQALPPAIAAVVVGFAKAAGQLGLAATLSGLKDPTSFGAELAQLAATRATLHTATGGHVNVAEAAKILGVKSRQAVHQRIERRTLLAMNVAGQIVIPTYQFDGARVRPEVTRAARLLAPAGLSEVAMVSWFTSPQPELDGITPAAWLAAGSEATRVYEAARHTAGALAH